MKKVYLFVLVLSFFVPTTAFAGSFITPGTPAAVGGAQATLTTQLPILSVEEGRSYACQVIGSTETTNLGMGTLGGTETNSLRKCGNITPQISVSNSNDGDSEDNRYCFVAPSTGEASFTVGSGVSGGEPARFECMETTLYGGYNTNANDFNFLEILNITNSDITVWITAINWDGTVVIDAEERLVTANNRVDVDVHSAAGSAKFGLIYVSHNGPYGALQAYVSQYTGPVSSLTLRTSNALSTREQNM